MEKNEDLTDFRWGGGWKILLEKKKTKLNIMQK
jgi:hypothetical protein